MKYVRALHAMRVAEPEKAEFLSLFTRYKQDIEDIVEN
jgi:hypothetical protein